ncbi:pyruvate kinase [Propioniciclava sinopodophylli]|uniref:Pyruvate kinase n=1 Tax=Propioniciclava sinopodophylli TaxID=1837344 RepID=A0A4Q9KD51_9ACTN|nr:PEP/pyruvate-binding domain-containing protein [Propioniciclava sinopodophylli]TBT83764.1 pyruvate kinase [Propioniciclava sinopodophylli]
MDPARVSTGIGGLDAAIDGLRIGDNVVWHCEDLDDFARMLEPYVAGARRERRRLVYVRFADHLPLVGGDDVQVHRLDPAEGFEPFAIAVHDLVEETGREAFYVFDSLAALLDAWHSDLLLTSFFKVTCPFLYELDTVAYFPLLRDEVSAATVAGIRETTQVLFDLQVVGDETYVHPLKVDGRSSATMFFPHLIAGERAIPVTSSAASARLAATRGRMRRRPDHWTRLVDDAFDALDGSVAEQRDAHALLADALLGRDDGRMAGLARRHLSLDDLLVVATRLVGTGHIGGKAVGMLTARAILADDIDGRFVDHLEPHDSFHLGADVFYHYLVSNGWWGHRLAQSHPGTFLSAGATLHELMPTGRFPASVREQLLDMLGHFGQAPIIVRSSSLLEDNFGNAFAGKYDSFFLTNQGSPEERLEALLDAVRAVYASAMSEEALRYRLSRNLAEVDEQMAILIQRVSGDHHGQLFFPHAAGVANSSNLYTWDATVDAEAGMLRLVFGLGTRAVDRTTSDHARIVALADPLNGRLSDPEDLSAFSQRRVDVLDLAAGRQAAVPLSELVATDVGADWSLFTSPDTAVLRRLGERERERGRPTAVRATPVVADFRGLLGETAFPTLMRDALATLAAAYDYPVDVEFTVNMTSAGEPRIGIVQCRPLQTRGPGQSVAIPEVADDNGVLFAAPGEFMGGNVNLPIDWVVMVRATPYLGLGSPQRHGVARLVGEVNRRLKDDSFLLLGPGRWGTTTESLGVPVRFAEINHAAALVEATDAAGNFRPELSYGSHFFQDLVETGIFYAAVFDDRPGVTFHPALVAARENALLELVPDADPHLAAVVHVARFDDLALYSDVVSQRVLCVTRGAVRSP